MIFVAFVGAEILFVGKVDAQETPVGAAVALVAAAVAVAAAGLAGRRYRIRAAWLRFVPRVGFGVVRDTVLLAGVLARRLAGGPLPDDRFEELPFEHGGDDSESTARRALAVAAVNASPNTIVISTDPERETMLLHRLTPGGGKPLSARWPI